MDIGYIILTYQFNKEGNRWVAVCPELGTSTFGRSIPEAERKIEEAIELHLNTLEDVGETGRFFAENNIEFHRTRPRYPVSVCMPANQSTFVRSHIQRVRELTAV